MLFLPGEKSPNRWPKKAWRRIGLLAIVFTILLGFSTTNPGLLATAKQVVGYTGNQGRVAVGLVDMPRLEKHHEEYDELVAIDDELRAREGQWWDYVKLLARQAEVDGLESPVLQGLIQGVDPKVAQSDELAAIWRSAERQSEEYRETLRRQTSADFKKQRDQLEQALAEEIAELGRQTQKEILKHQVKLAMLTLKQTEADLLLAEINGLQAEFERQAARVEEKYNGKLRALAEKSEKDAYAKMLSYNQQLMEEAIDESRLLELTVEPFLSGEPDGQRTDDKDGERALQAAKVVQDESLVEGFQRMGWQLAAGDLVLDTGAMNSLEEELLRARTIWERDKQELMERRAAIAMAIQGDIEMSIGEIARQRGLTVVVDASRTYTQGIDLTDQVLDMLRGEA